MEPTKGSLKKSANCCNVVRSCLVLLDWHTAVWKVWYIIQCCTVWFDIGTFKVHTYSGTAWFAIVPGTACIK